MHLAQDVRQTLRRLAGQPSFSAVAVLTLSLGIGATTAIFSVVRGVLLEPLPYPESDRLVLLQAKGPAGQPSFAQSPLNFRDVREQARSLTSLVAFFNDNVTLAGDGAPERLAAARVSWDFFALLDVRPAAGRWFLPDEDTAGAPGVAVISHRLWTRRFAGEAGVVGSTLLLNEEPHVIVGVAPPRLDFPRDTEVWLPAALDHERWARDEVFLAALGRLAPGVSLPSAIDDVARIAARLAVEYADTSTGLGFQLIPLHTAIVRHIRPALWILQGAVLLVLAIAAANVANLLLARAGARSRELAVRTALGAGRGRLVTQLLTESVVLGLVGGAAGVLLALASTSWLLGRFAQFIPRASAVGMDMAVLGFALLVALGSGLLFGLLPALQLAVAAPAPIQHGSRTVAGGGSRLGRTLVLAEVALALVLLVGATLLLRSFGALLRVDPGFSPENVLVLEARLPEGRYGDAARPVFFRALEERLRAVPGVVAAAAITPFPLSNADEVMAFVIEGRPLPERGEAWAAGARYVTPGYREAVRLPLLEGRFFEATDTETALPVMVVNRALVARHFPAGGALGERLSFQDPRTGEPLWRTIVGVVGNVRDLSLAQEHRPEVYLPVSQVSFPFFHLVVRGYADPVALVEPVREAVRSVDPALPVFNAVTAESLVADSLGRNRFTMTLLTLFAGVALLLAAVGVYGVLSTAVSRRARELGIRVALGAPRPRLLREVLWVGMLPVLGGVVLGLAFAWGLVRLLGSQLYGVSPHDPASFVAVTAVLVGAALAASLVPARRALRLDPVRVLRED